MSLTLDSNNSRRLGVGERINAGVFARPCFGDLEWAMVGPADYVCGSYVADDSDLEYREYLLVQGAEDAPEEEDPSELNVDHIVEMLGIRTEMGKKALALALRNVQVLDSKQLDYGSANIADFGEYGVLVRANDKVARLKNLLTNVASPRNESIEDSWLDLSNYSIIAVLCRRGDWR
jgi:hypothetical protein